MQAMTVNYAKHGRFVCTAWAVTGLVLYETCTSGAAMLINHFTVALTRRMRNPRNPLRLRCATREQY